AELKPSEQPTVSVRADSDSYVRTMQIPLLRGRDVAPSDRNAMLISASAAKLVWGNDDPVGRRAILPLVSRTQAIDVVAVFGDVGESLAETAPPTVYYYQRDLPFAYFSLAIRAAGNPTALTKTATDAVHAIDPQLPVQRVQTMDDVVEGTLVTERFRT